MFGAASSQRKGPVAMSGELRFELAAIGDRAALERTWSELERRAGGSFFQSWGWIEAWLEAVSGEVEPLLLHGREAGRSVLLGLLVSARTRLAAVVPVEVLHLSETGNPAHDALTVEHNGFLIEPGRERALLAAALEHLCACHPGWDELRISGLPARLAGAYREAAERAGLWVRVERTHPYFFVDLEALRASGQDHAATLSRNCRAQLRRTARRYGEHGTPRLRLAADPDEALGHFEALLELHQRTWTARGAPGAFASAFMREFHRRLIATRFERGEIQLGEARAGSELIGYLYAFVHRGVVSSYQSGLAYGDDPRLRPGLLAHHLAIEHNLAAGMRVYDLLAGESRFKRSICNAESQMLWLRLQRPRARQRLARGLERLAGRTPGRDPITGR